MKRLEDEAPDLGNIDSPPLPSTNDMALVSMLTGVGGWGVLLLGLCSLSSPFGLFCGGISVVSWCTALVTGYIAQREMRETGENGRDLARVGMAAGIGGVIAAMLGLVLLLLGVLGLISLGILDSVLQ